MAWTRWAGILLGVLVNVFVPVNPRLGLTIIVLMGIYNALITMSRRLPVAWVEPLLLAGLIGDFVVTSIYTIIYGSGDPTAVGFSVMFLVGAEASVLYCWRGVAWFAPLVLLQMLSLRWLNSNFQEGGNVIDFFTKAFLILSIPSVLAALTALSNTRREQAEAARAELEAANEQLRMASLLKSQFLASMSHVLLSPLSAIIGFSELLLDGIGGELAEVQRADVGQIRHHGRSLLDLVNDLIDLSRIEAGSLALEIEAVPVVNAIKEAVAAVGRQEGPSRIAIESGPQWEASMMRGDAMRIHQILLNLISVPLRFSTRGGGVTIRCREDGEQVELSLTHTRLDIPRRDLESIFRELPYADNTASQKYGGAGLELTICKRLVGLHQGRFGIEFVDDQSCRLWFTIPMAAAPGATHRQNARTTDAQHFSGEAEGNPAFQLGTI